MSRFWIFTGVLVFAMLLIFFVMQTLHLPFLEEDTAFMLGQEKWLAALAGIGLLIADVVAPVPSSMIMLANGMLFGPVWGTLLSMIGGIGAAVVGYWIGKKGEAVGKRWMGKDALARAGDFFQKYGMVAIIVSRPIPILAEALSIIAGIAAMPVKRFLFGAACGLLPTSVLYAVTGAYAVDLNSGLYAFIAVFVLASLVFLVGRYMVRPAESKSSSISE